MLENINSNLSIMHLEVQRYHWLFVFSCLKLNPLTCEVPNSVDRILNDRATTAVERELTLKRVIRTSWDHVGGNPSIGIVDKQCSGFIKHRLMHDLSRPDGSLQFKSYCGKEDCLFSWGTMDVIRPESFMAKIDVSEFYRKFPMVIHQCKDQGSQ
jgi:hypothetical protein